VPIGASGRADDLIYKKRDKLTDDVTTSPVPSASSLGPLYHWTFWVSRGSLALLDQGLIAISNFVIGILLARWLLPQQYGSYALAFSIFLLLSLVHQALVLEPQRVFGPTDYVDREREYLGVLLWIHSGLVFAISIVLGISAWVLEAWTRPNSLSGALKGLTFAAPCVLLLWLARGAFYVRMSPQRAVTGAAVYCTVVFASLTLIYRFGLLSPFVAFLIMGLAALIGSAVLLVQLQPLLSLRLAHSRFRLVLVQHWRYGRWLLVSSLLTWLTGDIYYLLVTSSSGIEAAGELKALLNFNLPVAQVLSALAVFFLPHASRVQQESGMAALAETIRRMTWLFAAVATAYWIVLSLLSKPIMQLLYGHRYAEMAPLIPLVALGSLPWNIAYVPTIALRAVRSSNSIFVTYCASGAVAVVVGIPATKTFGLHGTLWSIVLSSSAALLVAFCLFRRRLRDSSVPVC
jgi:O-antigen/teichoic acid export membrane protein